MRSPENSGGTATHLMVAAWLVTSVYYFYQYLLRSAPSVMLPELGNAFGLEAVGLASLVGLFYYGYAPFSLVAGVCMDQFGPRKVVPLGAAAVGIGALLFATGNPTLAGIGRFLQGAGGVFALIGAVYIATNYLPASRTATLIGATQMFGMAGGSAGQFLVGPTIQGGLAWDRFWMIMAFVAVPIVLILLFLIPSRSPAEPSPAGREGLARAGQAIAAVFGNPQSIMCGLIAGLFFIPTTIFDMVWGIRFLQEAHDMPYSLAVLRSASVPFGWIIGCPLLGWLSDRIGRRKPVIIGAGAVLFLCLTLILYGPLGVFPPFSLGLAAGIASGAAMIPYTVIKEANRPEHSGTATGVINFINFALTALTGPIFARLLVGASEGGERELVHYQSTFSPLLIGVGIAILLTFALRETGRTRGPGAPATATGNRGR
jgi:MFS family permease